MEGKYGLRIERVNNGFIVRFGGMAYIAQNRNEIAGLIGRLIVVELMSARDDDWEFEITAK